jgi:hypothetical protein
MIKIIKYNGQIFLSWFVYILLGKKLSKEAIELIKNNYKSTPREQRLFERIVKLNKQD